MDCDYNYLSPYMTDGSETSQNYYDFITGSTINLIICVIVVLIILYFLYSWFNGSKSDWFTITGDLSTPNHDEYLDNQLDMLAKRQDKNVGQTV